MIVGEVKEGPARPNRALRDPAVLEEALTQFGCCTSRRRRSWRSGCSTTDAGHAIRVEMFGDARPEAGQGPWHTVAKARLVQFLQHYLREQWPVLCHAQVRDQAFALLALLENRGLGSADAIGDELGGGVSRGGDLRVF